VSSRQKQPRTTIIFNFATPGEAVLTSQYLPAAPWHLEALCAFAMNARTRFLITAALVCHLLVAPRLVTSQLLAAENVDKNAEKAAADYVCPLQNGEDGVCALSQEKDGPVFKLTGQAEVHYGGYILRADEVTYNSDTGDAAADGHVVLDGGINDEHVEASHANYNLRTQSGKFTNVHGTIGLRLRNRRMVLTSSSPFVFSGKLVEKLGPDHYRVYDGTITTCALPRPKWQFNAGKAVVDVGGNATIYNSTFRIRGVPILYLPFATHPVQPQQRQSGFLMPNFGRSSIKGTILGDSFYWAINRSMDATFGADYYSRRGWAPQGEFRARPSEKSFLDLNVFAVRDRGIGTPPVKQSGQDIRLVGETTLDGFRGVANVDYLSSYVFRLAFYDVFTQAVNSEVKSQVFLSRNSNGFSYNAATERYQDFESTTHGDVVSILHAPSFESSSVDRQIANSPFYWAYDAAGSGLARSEPGFSTAPLLGRFDFSPRISLPLVADGWSLRPELAVRDTLYTQELEPSSGVGVAVDNPVNRKTLEGSVELRPPPLERVFPGQFMNRKWKHVVEPRIVYDYVTGVNNFDHILRFDDRDILSDTNQVEYAVVNRLYAKRTTPEQPNCMTGEIPFLPLGDQPSRSHLPWEKESPSEPACVKEPAVREILTWELAQKYFLDPTFGGALIPGQRNVFTTTADLTGIAFLMTSRHLSPLISRLRVQTTSRSDAEWDLDYDFTTSKINASTALLNYRLGQFTLGGGDALLQVPGEAAVSGQAPGPQRFNQFRVLLGYGRENKRGFSGAVNVGFDANLDFLQYSAVQAAYNWDCCGVNMEYRRFALGSVRNENQYRFTFALTNIGTFGNLKRQERLF
jgi:LPS-assembly protein